MDFFLVQHEMRSYRSSISETTSSLMASISFLDQFEWENQFFCMGLERFTLKAMRAFLTDSYPKTAQFCPFISKYNYSLDVTVGVFFIEIIEMIKQGEEKEMLARYFSLIQAKLIQSFHHVQ